MGVRELRSSPATRRRSWVRFAIVISFGGGVIAGMVLLNGFQEGWTATQGVLGATAVVLVLVANLVAVRRFPGDDGSTPLPGEIYKDRKKPRIEDIETQDLNGRVPFSVSKRVAKKHVNPELPKLYGRLEALNKELQRANVKLGLGQISKEGYTLIVEDLKKRRAQIEARINQADRQA